MLYSEVELMQNLGENSEEAAEPVVSQLGDPQSL
jgi:hypothetical protein